MAQYEKRFAGDFSDTVNRIDKYVMSYGGQVQSAGRFSQNFGAVRTCMLVYDKYYLRNRSRSSLSVLVTDDGNGCITVAAVGSGGGSGIFFSTSYGSEENFVSAVARAVEEKNF
ncbi:DUF6054 family protein [Lachnospiraceae bacterium NSJ-143]|nr:DUF6054 family protein [Lachnospiraceae bacterium NSJ-143]